MSGTQDFDAIVVGSGVTGGWAAKELTEQGLKVLMLERGREVVHGQDYNAEWLSPWEFPWRGVPQPGETKAGMEGVRLSTAAFVGGSLRSATEDPGFFVDPLDDPYDTPQDAPFNWIRSYQTGGKSLTWGRKAFRWSDLDFAANAADQSAIDWPIRYADLSSWYDKVEDFIGVAGTMEGIPHLPDGKFMPPIPLNHVEQAFKEKIESVFPDRKFIPARLANLTKDKLEQGRSRCQSRNICARGCSFGAYFSTQSSTLPAAQATGLLTVVNDARAVSIDHDAVTGRATGVKVLNTRTGARTSYTGRMIFLCAGAFNSTGLLLASKSEAFPAGLGNNHDVVGRYLMDHASTDQITADVPGYLDRNYTGFRPTNHFMPRFRNVGDDQHSFLRGYGLQIDAARGNWENGAFGSGVGAELKSAMNRRGGWRLRIRAFAETLPYADNRLTLSQTEVDADGLPRFRIALSFRENERALLKDANAESLKMLDVFGARVTSQPPEDFSMFGSIHEMGGARMGKDPTSSVVDETNRMHAAPNVFITDGACMTSSGWQNPSLTYMALTARAAANAVTMAQQGAI